MDYSGAIKFGGGKTGGGGKKFEPWKGVSKGRSKRWKDKNRGGLEVKKEEKILSLETGVAPQHLAGENGTHDGSKENAGVRGGSSI